ncbi:hypothetical protein D3C80_2004130 [compost metagenome]
MESLWQFTTGLPPKTEFLMQFGHAGRALAGAGICLNSTQARTIRPYPTGLNLRREARQHMHALGGLATNHVFQR